MPATARTAQKCPSYRAVQAVAVVAGVQIVVGAAAGGRVERAELGLGVVREEAAAGPGGGDEGIGNTELGGCVHVPAQR